MAPANGDREGAAGAGTPESRFVPAGAPLPGTKADGDHFSIPFSGAPFAGKPFDGPSVVKNEQPPYSLAADHAAARSPAVLAEERELLTSHHRSRRPERTVFRSIATLASLAVILAVTVNVLWSPAGARLRGAGMTAVVEPSDETPVAVRLEKPAISLLPAQILAHETLAHHPVPGQGDLSGEAIYATLNMNLEAVVPIGVYARAEGLASEVAAQERLDEILLPYQTQPETRLAGGVTPVRAGYSRDLGAYVVGWTRGPYAIFVKTHFKDKIPAEKRDLLPNQSRPVVEAIDLFQRTGQEGLQLGKGG